jgi:maltose alpha-D-glucosyltransferase/alpha-amylase
MVTQDERQFMWEQYAPDPRMRLNLGIRRRLAPLLDFDRRRIELLNTLLFSLPGSPIIYYGDEIGMGDDIWRHDRNGVRTPLHWNTDKNAGFSDADEIYEPVLNEKDGGYLHVNVEQQQNDPTSLWHTMRHMLGVRKRYRAFGRGQFEFELPDNEAVLGYWRVFFSEPDEEGRRTELERFLVLVNLTDAPQRFTLDLAAHAGTKPLDVLADDLWLEIEHESYAIELEPYASHWLKFRG